MSLVRVFGSIGQFAEFLETRREVMIPIGKLAIRQATDVLAKKTKAQFGSHALAELSEATQADRIAKGFTPNDPLKRDGSMLRDSVEEEAGEGYAAVGSPEPVAGYQEFGYLNARTGRPVPPRPAFKMGLEESAAPIMAIIEAMVGATLGMTEVPIFSNIESETATRSLEIE